MSALIGALRATLSADTAKFEAGMDRAARKAATSGGLISKNLNKHASIIKAGFAGLATGLTVGLVAGLTAAIKGSLEYAGALGETAAQLGVTTRELQTFRFAVQQNGGSVEDADKALGKFSIAISKTLSGSKEMAKAFAAVGVSLDDLKSKSKSDLLGQIADNMQRTGGASANAAAGMTLFGRGFLKVVPTLDLGSRGLNELAAAADELGIVLSDEQIRNADKTADKIDALSTAMKAQIAGVVANNAQAILDLANALNTLVVMLAQTVSWLGSAGRAFGSFQQSIPSWLTTIGSMVLGGPFMPGLTMAASFAGGKGGKKRRSGGTWFDMQPGNAPLPQFLAPKGGGGAKKAKAAKEDHTAERALTSQFQFESELRSAQMDVLRAQESLATNYGERAEMGLKILDAERRSYEAELAYEVEIFKLSKGEQGRTQAQADALMEQFNLTDQLKRQGIAEEVITQRAEDKLRLAETELGIQRDILEGQADLARTAEEQREIEMKLLDIAYQEELLAIRRLKASKDRTEQEEGRMREASLGTRFGAAQERVRRSTMGPLEEWADSIPQTAAEITEAFQQIQVDGLESLNGAIMDVITGTKSLKDAFGDLAQSIIADILQMTIRMMIFRAISGLSAGFGGGAGGSAAGAIKNTANLPKFASGGGLRVFGRGGTDRNVLSLNGLPIARVSHGERIDIANDNVNGGQAKVLIVPTPYFDAHVQGQAAKVAAPMAGHAAMAGAAGGMMGIQRRASRTLP